MLYVAQAAAREMGVMSVPIALRVIDSDTRETLDINYSMFKLTPNALLMMIL